MAALLLFFPGQPQQLAGRSQTESSDVRLSGCQTRLNSADQQLPVYIVVFQHYVLAS